MDPRRISDDFSVSPQITPQDVPGLARAGFRAILCNRPDKEEAGQPGFDAIAQAAADAGIEARAVPIVSGHLTEDDTRAFRRALEELPRPVLAYCRSGTRCTMMWSLTNFGDLSGEEIVRAAADAGYDMTGLVDQLRQRAR